MATAEAGTAWRKQRPGICPEVYHQAIQPHAIRIDKEH